MSAYDNNDLFKALIALKILDEKVLKDSLKECEENHIPLDHIILKKGLLHQDEVGKIISELISFPYINLDEVVIQDDVLNILSENFAKAQRMVCFKEDDTTVSIATENTNNGTAILNVSKKTGKKVVVYFTTQLSLEKALSLYTKDISETFDDIISKNVQKMKGGVYTELPIIEVVNTIITHAYHNNASDIHIEPLEKDVLVRFRIDGMLHDIVTLPLEINEQVVTRIKVMSNMRTDEHQETQDGKIVFHIDSEDLDIRVSVVPITRGEKVVMRLLSERSRQYTLKDLGLSDADLKKVQDAYHMPHGMILATGPTGSGKTTTLYAVLKLINSREVNIMTIEDPVEYQIEHVNQIQVNERAELTFAKGLRSIVRQDPDIILVGEIRDEETADISVNAAMTGHLVLSSLHTNDAVTSFPRLIDMNVEPYLVASTINVIIAQRLVRKICPKCKLSHEIDINTLDTQLQKFFKKKGKTIRVYQGKGCSLCRNTGYMGRIGIFEVLVINDEINKAITEKKSAPELQALAIKSGMTTMLEDGIKKVEQGITTIEELLRVTKD